MKKKILDTQLKELFYLNDWCTFIMNFILIKNDSDYNLRPYIEVIEDVFKKQDLRGMKFIFRDINEWTKALKKSDYVELNCLLKEKFGEDLINNNSRNLLEVKKIIKKGKITNEKEYNLIQNRIDDIFNNSKDKNEVENLNNLLAKFR